jgi:hypothetical protein
VLFQHRDEQSRVRPHVGIARRDVGKRQKFTQFADYVLLVGRDMRVGGREGGRFVGTDRHDGQRKAGQHPGCVHRQMISGATGLRKPVPAIAGE